MGPRNNGITLETTLPPEDQTAIEEQEPDDIRSLLTRAIEGQEDADPGQDTPAEPAPDTRARGPDGKFVRAEETPAHVESTPPEPTEPVAPPTTETPPATTAIQPPERWSQADRDTFAKIPAEAQEFVMRRYKEMEGDYTRKTQEFAGFRRDYEPVAQLLAPHMADLRQAGIAPAQLIQNWHAAEVALMTGRGPQLIRDIVNNPHYKIDKAALARELGILPPARPAAGVEAPPEPEAMHNGNAPIQLPPEVVSTIQALAAKQNQFDQFLTRQQQQQRVEAETRAMSTVTTFRDAKDATGNLAHPHYDELEDDMVMLLQAARASGNEPDLKTLYEKAVWANPSTREKVLSAQTAATEAQRVAGEKKARDEARAKAERAARAGRSVSGSPGSSQAAIAAAKADGKSLREALYEAVEEHSDAA